MREKRQTGSGHEAVRWAAVICAFPWDRLRRMSREDLLLWRRLRARSGIGSLQAVGQGLAELWGVQPRWGSSRAWRHAPPSVRERIAAATLLPLVGSGGEQALLALDHRLVRLLCRVALGIELPASVGEPVTDGERGLLAYLVATLLEHLGPDCPWSVELQRPDPSVEGLAAIEVDLVLGAGEGRAWLAFAGETVQPGRSRRDRRPLVADRLRPLPLRAAVVKGRIELPACELEGLANGDLIVSPTCPRADSGAARLEIGTVGFQAQVAGRTLTITGPCEQRAHWCEGATEMATAERKDERPVAVDQLPVEVVIEIGRLELTGGEVIDLAEGDVLTLGRPVGTAVDLRVGGRLLARGELVDVDDEVGVRIVEID